MTGTSLYRFFGLSYLLVRTAESRSPVWIPLFIERYELFRELMILYADATHELDRKLQESTAV
jgi:hypothetical protein